MCGLHGIITRKRELNADDFINSAFVANMLRGVDSSGIASIDVRKNIYDYHKLPINGAFFTGDSVAKRIIRGAGSEDTITMCHVRAATVGNVNVSNAHPFVYKDTSEEKPRVVIGTHNGTLVGWSAQKNGKYYTVDSEWAINHIVEEGFDAFEDFRGAYCFVWWDSDKKDTLNIARNKERPMFVAMLESGGMAYASEAGMLHWLLDRHDVKVKGDILELQEDHWYKFSINDPTDFIKIKLPSTQYSTTSRNSYTLGPVVGHTTAVGRVTDLLTRVRSSEASKPTGLPVRHAMVSPTEYEAARTMNLLGEEALFTPISEWADGIEGLAVVVNSEVSATVRGYDERFNSDEEWHCRVIGVQDDGDEVVAILSAPTMKERKTVVH